ncbi:MAG: InlB B-repeat-containing protein, partial [Clostridia bacterium]|nr:InlB B-repeat-containing protein [Clostridia bacterium]
LAKITLQLDGGSLADSELYLKAGANVADFMKNYQPTKSGLIFGAWFDGETELAANKKMPADGLTLTAKYKVEYTVKLMLETVDGGEYTEEKVVNSDYVGKNITVAEAPEGFTEIAHDGTNKTGVLSANSAENVFTQYFNRNSYTLTFRPNYPADTTGSDENITIAEKFGVSFETPDEFSCAGYVLAGWALSANGEVAYKTNQIERLVFNTDGAAPEKATMEMLGKDASLYAVWKKGYVDMFGGADTIFFLDEGEEGTTKSIYLSRGGRYFSGVYHVRQEIFEFQMKESKINGKLYAGDVFAYSSAKRDESWSALYDNGNLQEDTRIDFGKYNEITYTEKDSAGFAQKSEGTYVIDENGYYVADFTSGNLQGKSLSFIVGTVTANGKPRNAFQVRKDDEIALGDIVGYKVNGKTAVADADAYTITLNGLGIATCRTTTTQASYYYSITDGVLTLRSRYGGTILVARITEKDGKNVYFEYDETVDQTFAFENGNTIALNGSHEAVYTVDGKEEKGLFTVVSTSVFGGSIVDVYIGDKTYRMNVKTREEKVLEDGEIKPKYYYEAENRLEGYAEYFYLNNGLVYYAPLLVVDAENEGEAKLYGLNNDTNEYILASKGEYKKMEGFDRYIYTVSEWYACEEANTDPFDLSLLKIVVFNVDTDATAYSLSYWYSTANGDKDTTEESIDYSKTYTSAKDDNASLTLVSGFAFYKDAKELTYEGAYAVKDGIMTVFAGKESYYFEIDEENKQFIALDYNPYKGYIVKEDGDIEQT